MKFGTKKFSKALSELVHHNGLHFFCSNRYLETNESFPHRSSSSKDYAKIVAMPIAHNDFVPEIHFMH